MFVYMGAMWLLGLMARGFGLVFIPSGSRVRRLAGSADLQESALYNLMRQLGGSFGIAVLNTYIANMTAYHRAGIVAKPVQWQPNFQDRLSGLAGAFISNGYSQAAAH